MRSSKTWISVVLLSCLLAFSCERDRRGLVVGKIHKASKLATTEFTINKIVHGTKTRRLGWVIKLNEARFIAYSTARIKTGINLEKLTREDIEIEDQRISLKLPPIEVLNFSYPPGDFRIDRRISDDAFLNSISVMDQEQFFRRAELDIRNNMEHMGIVETSQQKTRSLLTVMLKSLGYREVYIEFESDELIIDRVPMEEET